MLFSTSDRSDPFSSLSSIDGAGLIPVTENEALNPTLDTSLSVKSREYISHTPIATSSSYTKSYEEIANRNRADCVVYNKIKCNVAGEIFSIWNYYKPRKVLGRGAYGVVLWALDSRTNTDVAIKKNTNVFADLDDAKRIYREIKLLCHFDHPNIIKLLDVIPPRTCDRDTFDAVFIVMPKIHNSLAKLIHSKRIRLSSNHRRYITYQILQAVNHIHSAGVIHRDLTPNNILVTVQTQVKIIDFGLARSMPESEDELTEYVCARWYRAPEIMLSRQKYDHKVDVWSIACMFAEMLLKRPLFECSTHLELLQTTMHVLGAPKPHELYWITDQQALQWVHDITVSDNQRQNAQYGYDLRKLFNNSLPEAIDLLSEMLVFNPLKRISIDDALKHPYFAPVGNDQYAKPAKKFHLEENLNRAMNTEFGARNLIFDELQKFYPLRRTSGPQARPQTPISVVNNKITTIQYARNKSAQQQMFHTNKGKKSPPLKLDDNTTKILNNTNGKRRGRGSRSMSMFLKLEKNTRNALPSDMNTMNRRSTDGVDRVVIENVPTPLLNSILPAPRATATTNTNTRMNTNNNRRHIARTNTKTKPNPNTKGTNYFSPKSKYAKSKPEMKIEQKGEKERVNKRNQSNHQYYNNNKRARNVYSRVPSHTVPKPKPTPKTKTKQSTNFPFYDNPSADSRKLDKLLTPTTQMLQSTTSPTEFNATISPGKNRRRIPKNNKKSSKDSKRRPYT